uniref:ATP synthase subunit a n=1 Tax=Paravannella minima TaxID=1443144 RepID=A0A411K7P9_9EUKA|nr:H(+)-transporting ATPase subunit 6 [Paravannella minima]QBC73445.1 H(+)-transporting ATPase subunit 6 [Paravannella minima]
MDVKFLEIFFSPLEQFKITVFFPQLFDYLNYYIVFSHYETMLIDVYFTSFFIYLFFSFFTLFFFFSFYIKVSLIIPNTNWQYFCETLYNFIYGVLSQQLGKDTNFFFSLIFSLFLFILICNFVGMIPYGFTSTAFLIETFTLSFSFLIAINIIGFQIQGIHFFDLFVPKGVPQVLLPFIVFIEFISHMIKPVSLGVRLFANLMSGHSLLNILSGFVISLSKFHFFIGLIPFCVIVLICFLELGIAFLQAYVFITLVSIYLSDSLGSGSH